MHSADGHSPTGRSLTDLTSAIASGDSEAFALFFRQWFSWTYGEARRVTRRDESFCLDVVQDAMVRVIRSLPPTGEEQHLKNWLRVVVRACAYDRLRKDARLRRRESAISRNRASQPDHQEMERLEWLEQELKKLDDPQSQLLVMRFRLGWTLQRIGNVLGIKPGAVDGRLTRIIAYLRRRARETLDE